MTERAPIPSGGFAERKELPPVSPFANDDGRVDPHVAAALAALAAGTATTVDLVEVLRGRRLLIAVLAHAEGHEAPATVVGVGTPDGRTALPVFTSVDAMVAWHPDARPMPVTTEQAALAAIDEDWQVLVLDPAGPAIRLPRPAVFALMTGTSWVPAIRDGAVDPAVSSAVADALGAVGPTVCEPGERSELRIVVGLPATTSAERRAEIAAFVQAALAADPVVVDRVDSLEVTFRPL